MPRVICDADGKEFLLFNGEVSGPVTEQIYDLKKRIEDMNREKVDLQVLSVTPLSYSVDTGLASALACAQNDAISELVEKHPERFIARAKRLAKTH
jgi:aminocarboxymuconate-semialdehyde decarboxylase